MLARPGTCRFVRSLEGTLCIVSQKSFVATTKSYSTCNLNFRTMQVNPVERRHSASPGGYELPLGNLVVRLDATDISPSDGPARISNFQCIASYNWLDSSKPVILVPGSPAIWSPPANCPRIEPDKGEIFIDQNTALYSSFPLEPMFRAIYEVHPELDLEEVDVVICRNTMGKLFDFVMNYSKNFEIDVEIVGNKAIFVRKEKKTTGFMNFQGFGHTFPKEYTRWDSAVKGSTSHHRVAEYEFAGLKYLVRFSSDGYLAENAGHQKVSSPRQSIADPVSTTKLLSSGGFPMISEKRPITGHELVVRNGGIEVDQAATIKIKTQGIHSRVDIESVLPRLWMSQTPNLIVAYHKNGRFEDVQILDMRKHLAKWEEANSLNLRKLNAIIRQIIDTVQNTISRKCRIKRTDNKELEIWELDISHQSALPADLCRKLGGKDLEDEDERSKHTGQVNFARDLWEDDDDDDLKDDYGYSDTDESIKDYTACSSEHCGNCGHCDY